MPFANPSLTFEAEANGGPVTILTPLTGTTYIMRPGIEDLYVNPAGTIAAWTLQLPVSAGGRRVKIYFTQIVTALSVRDRLGNVVATAPTAATANLSIEMRHINNTIGWVRWR